MNRWLLVGVVALAVGCPKKEEPAAPVKREAPKGFEPLERVAVDAGEDAKEAMYRVAPFTVLGPAAPAQVTKLELEGEPAKDVLASADLKQPLLLVVKDETYLAQVTTLLAALDDAKAEVWLAHPDSAVAYKVTLSDEPAFQHWIDEASEGGKLRVIHRADGFELQTSVGKLPGPDVNGPSVPVRGGQMDLATLQRGFTRLKGRFTVATDYCVVPSFGMPMADVIRALAANYPKADAPIFATTCLVYPRPRSDAGR